VFSFGGSEILIILVVALLLFGPDKIPQLARTIGRFTREFNKYKDIMESTIRMEFNRMETPEKDGPTVEERIAKAGNASAAIIERDRGLGSAADEPDAESETDDDEAPVAVSAPRPVARPSADESDEEDEG
jgi:TatA/E family protein of Tat protein translocase